MNTVRKLNEKRQRYRRQRGSWGPLSLPFIVSHDRVTSGRFAMSGQHDRRRLRVVERWMGGRGGPGKLSPRSPFPRDHKRISMYMVGAFLRGGYVTVPRCWPCEVSPLLLYLIESLSLPPPSLFLCLSWFISLPPSPYTKPSSLPAGHRIPICPPRVPPVLSLKSLSLSLSSLLSSHLNRVPHTLSPRAFVPRIRCRPLRVFKRPDTLVYRWYHRSWLQPLSFYPSPTGGEDNIGSPHGLLFSSLLSGSPALRIREERPH